MNPLDYTDVSPAYALQDTLSPETSEAQQHDFLTHLHQTLNTPRHLIRQRLDRICTASPDLLAVIKQQSRV